jgi:hypothetical protein
MNKNEIWEEIKQDKSIIYGQSMLEVFLQTTEDLKIDHYLELNDKQKKLINDANLAYKLAKKLYERTKQRSSELEPIIMKDPYDAYGYAKEIIQGRWKEAEPIIIKDPKYAYHYAMQVIKGKWIEAEQYIIKDPRYACLYALNIIKDRWIEAEETIKKDPYWWDLYKQLFKL